MDQVFPNSALRIKSGSTWYFSCKSVEEQKKFEHFLRGDISITTVTNVAVMSAFYVGLYSAAYYYKYPTMFNLVNLIMGFTFEILLSFILIILYIARKRNQDETKEIFYDRLLTYLENLFVIGYIVADILLMASATIDGLCVSSEENQNTHECSTSRRLPEAFMGLMFVFPIMLTVAIKSAKSEFILLSWLSSFVFLMVTIIIFNYSDSWAAFVAFALVTSIMLYEYQRQKISTYFIAQELISMKTENERLAEENRASELKHLIGNVAHDLKTPLSSLNMGIDLMSGELLDFVEKTASVPEFIRDRIRAHVAYVEENLRNMKNVNAFMLMTINRCMDYTKATTGLKLVPKLGTVALLETIALPLHVMNAMHDGKTKIELMPVSADICNHIITDMQWLQENVMCLLSNAVKYSNKGLITMRVSIVTKSPKVFSADGGDGGPNYHPSDTVSHMPLPTSEPLLGQHGLVPFPSTTDLGSQSEQIASGRRQSYLRVEVEDNGIGLSDEVMQSLFSPFKQAQRLAGGTGLGLFSLSRRLDAIGGFYGVERRCDGLQGSVFWFEIPYKPDIEYADNLLASEESSSGLAHYSMSRDIVPIAPVTDAPLSDFQSVIDSSAAAKQDVRPLEGKLNILLADDTLSIQKMTCMLLRRQGHVVTVAENGAEALEMVTAKYTECEDYRRNGGSTPPCLFDVVLMDFQMPVMDGLEATSRIRKLEKELSSTSSRASPLEFHQVVIGLSANSDEETVQLAKDAGVDDFMEKPFKAAVFDEIWSRIGKMV